MFPEFGIVNQRGKWTPWSDTIKKGLSLLQSNWGIGNQGEIDRQNYQYCVRSSSCLEIGLSTFVMAWDIIIFPGQVKAKGVKKSYKDLCGIRIKKRTVGEENKNEKKKKKKEKLLTWHCKRHCKVCLDISFLSSKSIWFPVFQLLYSS